MERHRRAKGKKKRLLGSHQKAWVWGRNLVAEILRAGRWPVRELYFADDLCAAQRVRLSAAAERAGVTPRIAPSARLFQLCHSREHQGLLARMGPFPYDSADALLAARPAVPLYAVLDRVQDPFNFGAILRSAEVFGVDAVFIGRDEQAPVTSAVARSSAGAVNHIPIAVAEELCVLLAQLQRAGIVCIATAPEAGTELPVCDLTRPTAFVVGNEGSGVAAALLGGCDARVRIPQHGRVGSLNAAVAASIVFYEARRQRR